jgi:hypothetical protein
LRRQSQSVQAQTKPVYPSYHLEPTIPISDQPRPTDKYRPLNILRSSPRPPLFRLPSKKEEDPPVSVVSVPSEPASPIHEKEEFIAVVFDNEVWMGLVDFKSDNPPIEDYEAIDDISGISFLWRICRLFSSKFEEIVCDLDSENIQNTNVSHRKTSKFSLRRTW